MKITENYQRHFVSYRTPCTLCGKTPDTLMGRVPV